MEKSGWTVMELQCRKPPFCNPCFQHFSSHVSLPRFSLPIAEVSPRRTAGSAECGQRADVSADCISEWFWLNDVVSRIGSRMIEKAYKICFLLLFLKHASQLKETPLEMLSLIWVSQTILFCWAACFVSSVR